VAKHYNNNASEETNVLNIISAIITDYRAFDTLGETTVLFTSITAVVSVLGIGIVKHKGDL
jgi:multicomponent Na+:H+ antiporter subunit B